MRNNNVIEIKSKAFALRIIHMYQYLRSNKREYVISKQALRSGTSIGVNIKEAAYAQTKADFLTKMTIALKEASETEYWLYLLYESGFIGKPAYRSIHHDCEELIRLLTAIVKSTRSAIQVKSLS